MRSSSGFSLASPASARPPSSITLIVSTKSSAQSWLTRVSAPVAAAATPVAEPQRHPAPVAHRHRAAAPTNMASASCVAPPATCHARSSVACSGYVGQGARPAAEYHEHDFDWEEHAAAVRHIVEAQEAAGRALRAAKQVFSDAEEGTASERVAASLAGAACAAAAGDGHRPEQQAAAAAAVALAERPREDQSAPSTDATSTSSSSLSQGAASWRNKGRQAGLGGGALSAAAAAESAASGGVPAASTSYEGDRWEEFYKAHPSARFFKVGVLGETLPEDLHAG